MITAVDTNIILDVLIPDEPFSESSKSFWTGIYQREANTLRGRLCRTCSTVSV